MQKRISLLRSSRRRRKLILPNCPKCNIPMKRKGKGTQISFKCPKCKGKIKDGVFREPLNPENLQTYLIHLKDMRKELAKRKLIRKLKKEKYLGYKSFQWEGEIINLDDYDYDGISFAEKKRQEEEQKKVERERQEMEKKAEKKEQEVKKDVS